MERAGTAGDKQSGVGQHLTEHRQTVAGAVDPAVAAVGQQLGRQLFGHLLLARAGGQHALQLGAGLIELDDDAGVLLDG